MDYNEFINKFLNDFNNIRSFKEKERYANQYLNRIGSGSGRIVYDIDGTKVLKLAKNSKGIAQNEVEYDIANDYYAPSIITEVYEHADDNSWIVAEEAKKVSPNRIKQLTGIPDLYTLHEFLFEKVIGAKKWKSSTDQKLYDIVSENDFANDLLEFTINFNQKIGDYSRPSSYGEVLRNGEPTIVLTDYGISDEVYSTYYAPKRNQRIYELFNVADGNDDILSDIGNVDAVRKGNGMWALMPYSVSDGENAINEDFVHFISNRDYYPSQPLSVMPYIMECFHDCVNNLKEILNHVNDKKKFYNNLLKLQEHLINQYDYDREPLKIEEYNNLNEINPDILDKKQAFIIANKVANIKGDINPVYLGKGDFGFAFDIGNNRILKITTDKSEAIDNLKLIGKSLKYIAEPYEVFKVENDGKSDIYGIVLEKLKTDKSFKRMYNRLDYVFEKILNISFPMMLGGFYKINNEERDKINKYFLKNPNDYLFYKDLLKIKDELREYGITSTEYTNPSNLGYKSNGNIALFDVGFDEYVSNDVNVPSMSINEFGGSSLYVTANSNGDDDFPEYDNNDTSPLTDNNVPPFSNEDLEYHHADDPTKDKFKIDERIKSVMPGSNSVEVKKKCRLGGLGNTSVACNQGDISNLNIKSIKEDAGEKYAENKFGIKPEFSDFEEKYKQYNISKEKEDVVYRDGGYMIIRNPKNLKNIGDDVRGIIDKYGNLYTENVSNNIHDQILIILDNLGLVKNISNWDEVLPTEFITVTRYMNQNVYILGESNYMLTPDDDRDYVRFPNWKYIPKQEDAIKAFQIFIDKARIKNPNIKFENVTLRQYDDGKFKEYDDDMDEDVGEKYAEKKFGIKPQFSDFENKYNVLRSKEEIVYIYGNYMIIRNPKSLEYIDSDARGIIDKDGNLYTENKDYLIHDDILKILNKLGLVKYVENWYKLLPSEFITVQRYKNTNIYLLGESTEPMIPNEDREEIFNYRSWDDVPEYNENTERIYQSFLDKAKMKNPNINFKNEVYTEDYDYVDEDKIIKENINEARNLMNI